MTGLAETGAVMRKAFTLVRFVHRRAPRFDGAVSLTAWHSRSSGRGRSESGTTAWLDGLPTLADYLHGAGYSAAMCGKWHCGAGEKPKSGFDYGTAPWRKTPKYSTMTHKYSDQAGWSKGKATIRKSSLTPRLTSCAIVTLGSHSSSLLDTRPRTIPGSIAKTGWSRIIRDATFRDIPDDMPYAMAKRAHIPSRRTNQREALAQYYASSDDDRRRGRAGTGRVGCARGAR